MIISRETRIATQIAGILMVMIFAIIGLTFVITYLVG